MARDPHRDGKEGQKKPPRLTGPGRSRNPVFEDLLRFTQMVRRPTPQIASSGATYYQKLRGASGTRKNASWDLTDLFLQEVLIMSPDRIQRIREFADALAAYIEKRNDAPFFQRITFARYPGILRGNW